MNFRNGVVLLGGGPQQMTINTLPRFLFFKYLRYTFFPCSFLLALWRYFALPQGLLMMKRSCGIMKKGKNRWQVSSCYRLGQCDFFSLATSVVLKWNKILLKLFAKTNHDEFAIIENMWRF